MRGSGRVAFVAWLLLIAGVLNSLGWTLVILGAIQLTGGLSLLAGNTYGRVLGIIGGTLGAIGALFSIGGQDPWWSLCVFAICIYIVHGIFIFGEDEKAVAGM